jgi:hypothetical protein
VTNLPKKIDEGYFNNGNGALGVGGFGEAQTCGRVW